MNELILMWATITGTVILYMYMFVYSFRKNNKEEKTSNGQLYDIKQTLYDVNLTLKQIRNTLHIKMWIDNRRMEEQKNGMKVVL